MHSPNVQGRFIGKRIRVGCHNASDHRQPQPGDPNLCGAEGQISPRCWPKLPSTAWKPPWAFIVMPIKPAKASVSAFREKLQQTLKRLHGSNARCLIKALNPIIRGWANYYPGVVSSEIFQKLGHDIFWKLRRWISKTHPTKSYTWRDRRYWAEHPAYPGSQWNFVDKDTGMVLYRIGSTRIQRHVLIQGDASPDNPDFKDYFEQRNQGQTK